MAGDLPQPSQEAGLGPDESLKRLNDDRGQLVGVGCDDALHRAEVVEWRDQHVGLDGVRDARGVRHRRGEGFG